MFVFEFLFILVINLPINFKNMNASIHLNYERRIPPVPLGNKTSMP